MAFIICECLDGIYVGNIYLIFCRHKINEPFIFFTEDINEQVYKIDKMFTQLFNIKQFRDNIQAIILGEFLDSGNQVWLDELFEEIASTHNIPVVSGFKITHGKDKLTLPIGAEASLIDGELLVK